MKVFLFACFVSMSVSLPQWQNNDDTDSNIHHNSIQVEKGDTQMTNITTESDEMEVSKTFVFGTNVVVEEVSVTIHSNASTFVKTYIREQWSLNELLNNTLTFGNSPIGNNFYAKIILSFLLLLCLLIFVLYCNYRIFIRYCYDSLFVVDEV